MASVTLSQPRGVLGQVSRRNSGPARHLTRGRQQIRTKSRLQAVQRDYLRGVIDGEYEVHLQGGSGLSTTGTAACEPTGQHGDRDLSTSRGRQERYDDRPRGVDDRFWWPIARSAQNARHARFPSGSRNVLWHYDGRTRTPVLLLDVWVCRALACHRAILSCTRAAHLHQRAPALSVSKPHSPAHQ